MTAREIIRWAAALHPETKVSGQFESVDGRATVKLIVGEPTAIEIRLDRPPSGDGEEAAAA